MVDQLLADNGNPPAGIKALVSEKEYRWMTEEQRHELQGELTQPPDEEAY